MVRRKLAGFSRDAVLYGAGDAVGRLVGLVMFPILSRIFVPADYGAIDLLMISSAFVCQFAQFGVPAGLQRYYYKREGHDRRVLVTTSVSSVSIFAALLGVMIFWVAPWLADWFPEEQTGVTEAIRWIAVGIPFLTAADQMQLVLRLQGRAIVFSLVNVSKIVIQPVLTAAAVVGFDLGIRGVFVAHASTAVITAAVSVVLIRRDTVWRPDFTLARDLVRFGLPGHPAILIVQAMQLLPRYVLAAFAPLSAVGLFGVGLRIAGLQLVFIRAFARAWNPFAFANEKKPDEGRLYELALRGAVAVVTWLALVFSIFAPEMLRVLAPAEYGAAAWLVPGIALHFAVDGVSPIFGTILYTRNAVKWTSYVTLIRLGTFLVLALLTVPRFQTAGLIASLLVSVGVQLVAYAVVCRRRFPIELPWMRAAAVLAMDALFYAGVGAANLPWPALVAIKLVVCAAALSLSILMLLGREDRIKLLTLVRRKTRPAATA